MPRPVYCAMWIYCSDFDPTIAKFCNHDYCHGRRSCLVYVASTKRPGPTSADRRKPQPWLRKPKKSPATQTAARDAYAINAKPAPMTCSQGS